MTGASTRIACAEDKISVCVFVSGGGTNLQALLDESKAGHMPSAEISLVVSDKETAFALTRAKNAGVDSCVIGWLNEEKLRKNTGMEKPCSLVVAFGYAAKTASGEAPQPPQKRRAALKDKIIDYEN